MTTTTAGAMARRLAAWVNAEHADDKQRAQGYRDAAAVLRKDADRIPKLPDVQTSYRNAADLLDDWALHLYKVATV